MRRPILPAVLFVTVVTASVAGCGSPTIIASMQSHPTLIAAGSSDLWFVDQMSAGTTLLRVSDGGGTPTVIATGLGFGALAADDRGACWTNLTSVGNAEVYIACVASTSTTPVQTDTGTNASVGALVLDATSVYWADAYGHVFSAPRSGGGVPTSLTTQGASSPALAIDDTAVWVASGSGVLRILTAPPHTVTSYTLAATPTALASDGTTLYAIETNGFGSTGSIVSAPVADPTAVASTLVPSLTNAAMLQVQGGHLYFLQQDTAAGIWRATTSGGALTHLSLANAIGLAVTSSGAYWTDGDATVHRTDL